MLKVVITGGTLQFPEGAKQNGDLWDMPECAVWIFNAVAEPEERELRKGEKVLTILDEQHHQYFERRNVYVIPKAWSVLNDKAIAYIIEGEKLSGL